jgi:hypothetical protein
MKFTPIYEYFSVLGEDQQIKIFVGYDIEEDQEDQEFNGIDSQVQIPIKKCWN